MKKYRINQHTFGRETINSITAYYLYRKYDSRIEKPRKIVFHYPHRRFRIVLRPWYYVEAY